MASNAVPVLLNLLHAKYRPYKEKVIEFLNTHSTRRDFNTAEDYHEMACFGFSALGPLGENAVPALIDSLNDTDYNLRAAAINCLGSIGPPARSAEPALVQFITNKQPRMRISAIMNLGRIHTSGPLVVPILITNLTNSNAFHAGIIDCLGKFGTQAQSATPILTQFLTNEVAQLRSVTTNALRQIDPEAAAKAGVK